MKFFPLNYFIRLNKTFRFVSFKLKIKRIIDLINYFKIINIVTLNVVNGLFL